MRREYIEFKPNMNIDFKLASIQDYPLVWHNSLRIFFVLKGSYIIGIENEEFCLEERAIEIINQDEPYYITSKTDDNLVLILDIKPEFFKAYNDKLGEVYYYTDTLDGSRQLEDKYVKLREYIGSLLYEFIGKTEGYEDRTEAILLKTMFHLLNNFHYLIYEEASLKEDEIQLERFTRIISYLKKNYDNRVSLKEIAEREHLTPQYLSYKIKDTFGQNFNDFLNKIRVDESRKLLLATSRSISEIALEVGFSHSRYYNKHFKKIHGSSPLEYRKKYKKTGEELEGAKKLEYISLKEGLGYLKPYIENYENYGKKRIIVRENIDLEGEVIKTFKGLKIIDLGTSNLLEYRTYKELAIMKEKFNLSHIIYRDAGKYDTYENEDILAKIYGLGFIPLIAGKDLSRLEIFLKDYGLLEERPSLKYLREDLVNNRLEGLGNFYRSVLAGDDLVVSFRDEKQEGIFPEDRGLLTRNYFKKPIYLACELVAKLGREVIYLRDHIIVTRSSLGFEILLHNESLKDLKRFSLNIEGLREDYIYLSYKIDLENSIYDKWEKLGRPRLIKDGLGEVLRKSIRLKEDLGLISKANVANLVYDLEAKSSILISFRKKKG